MLEWPFSIELMLEFDVVMALFYRVDLELDVVMAFLNSFDIDCSGSLSLCLAHGVFSGFLLPSLSPCSLQVFLFFFLKLKMIQYVRDINPDVQEKYIHGI